MAIQPDSQGFYATSWPFSSEALLIPTWTDNVSQLLAALFPDFAADAGSFGFIEPGDANLTIGMNFYWSNEGQPLEPVHVHLGEANHPSTWIRTSWADDGQTAYFQRTDSHDELFR